MNVNIKFLLLEQWHFSVKALLRRRLLLAQRWFFLNEHKQYFRFIFKCFFPVRSYWSKLKKRSIRQSIHFVKWREGSTFHSKQFQRNPTLVHSAHCSNLSTSIVLHRPPSMGGVSFAVLTSTPICSTRERWLALVKFADGGCVVGGSKGECRGFEIT